MNFQKQAEQFMLEIANRKCDPVKANTLHVYRSILDARILPAIGGVEVADVNNKTAKMLVGRLTEAKLSPATITLAVTLVKQIVKSATDEEGNQLYPRTWNSSFIDAPRVDRDAQKTPIASQGHINAITVPLGASLGEVRVLVALLAGTGLRVGEALALSTLDDGIDNLWDPAAGTIAVRATLVRGKIQDSTKTKAGTRVVDLDPALNDFMRSQFANRGGRVFRSSQSTLRRQIAALGIEGFHSMRRFRITHLQSVNVPGTMIKFWAGHAAADVTERYTKMGAQIQERKSWSERAGLGFSL